MKKALVLALGLMAFSPVYAGEQVGTVEYVVARAGDGLVYFNLIGAAKVGAPACAKYSYWMIRDEKSEVGKQQYAMLLAAFSSGKKVRITGMNTCLRWVDGEDVNTIQIFHP